MAGEANVGSAEKTTGNDELGVVEIAGPVLRLSGILEWLRSRGCQEGAEELVVDLDKRVSWGDATHTLVSTSLVVDCIWKCEDLSENMAEALAKAILAKRSLLVDMEG